MYLLETGTTWEQGNFPSFRQSLKIIDRDLHIGFPKNFVIRILSIS